MKIRLAAHGRHTDTIAITADSGNDPFDEAAGFGVRRVPESQCVQQRNRTRPHGKDIAHNTADPGCGPLIGLDIGGVVMAFHLEDRRLAVANIDDASVFARTANDARAGDGEFFEVQACGFIRAMLAPHHREYPKLDHIGLAAQPIENDLIFFGFEPEFDGGLQHGFDGGACWVHGL